MGISTARPTTVTARFSHLQRRIFLPSTIRSGLQFPPLSQRTRNRPHLFQPIDVKHHDCAGVWYVFHGVHADYHDRGRAHDTVQRVHSTVSAHRGGRGGRDG